MKPIILAALLLSFSLSARADGDPHICSLTGSVFETAAQARDMQVSPEQALKMVAPYDEIPLWQRKQIINVVYFDSRFAGSGGEPLRRQMMSICLNGLPAWKPLK